MVTHADPSVRAEEGRWCKSHIYNANSLSFSEHRVYSHSYCKPMSTVMADLMTSQVHSTHATALVAREKKAAKQLRKDRSATDYCNLATAVPFLFVYHR